MLRPGGGPIHEPKFGFHVAHFMLHNVASVARQDAKISLGSRRKQRVWKGVGGRGRIGRVCCMVFAWTEISVRPNVQAVGFGLAGLNIRVVCGTDSSQRQLMILAGRVGVAGDKWLRAALIWLVS